MPVVRTGQLDFACALVSLPDQGPRSLVWKRDYVCAFWKWRPTQLTAATKCWEGLLLPGVNLKKRKN